MLVPHLLKICFGLGWPSSVLEIVSSQRLKTKISIELKTGADLINISGGVGSWHVLMLTPGPTPKIWTKSSKFQVLICSKNVSLQNHKIHNQNIYNYACAEVSCKEDEHCIFACPPPPHPPRGRLVCMRDGDAQGEKHTWMSLFMMLTL